MSSVAQRNFAGGELAPSLYAHTDQAKYQTGLRQCRNFIVQRHGGVANRPGTEFIGEVKDSTKPVRFIKFVLNASLQNVYVIELGQGYARFHQMGARVTVVGAGAPAWADATAYIAGDLVTQLGVTYYCSLSHTSALALNQPGTGSNWLANWYALSGTIFEIPTPYLAADLPNLRFVQSADVITLVHPSYAPRELKRYGHIRWVLSAIAFGPSLSGPPNLAAVGGLAGVNTYYAVTSVKETTLEESLPSLFTLVSKIPNAANIVSVSWDQAAGAVSYNVYRSVDGKTYGLISSAGGLTLPTSDNTWTTNTSTVSTNTSGIWAQAVTQARNPLGVSATLKAYDGNYKISGKFTVSASGGPVQYALSRIRAFYSRNGEPRIDAGILASTNSGGSGNFTNTQTFSDTVNVPDNGYSTLTIDLVPEVYFSPNLGAPTATCSIDFTTTPNDNISWVTGVSGFADVGAAPNYAFGPPAQASTFASVDHYPSAVGYYQQRQVFGNTNTSPEQTWASRTGSYRSFALSTPLQHSDMVSFAMAGQRVNAVQHFLDLGILVVFTSGEEKYVEGDQSGILRPDAINPKKISSNGTSALRPLEIDDSALYVQARGTRIRDLKPVRSNQFIADSYQGTDLTIFATHLFDGYTLVDWDYAYTPNSIVWAARSDGVLLGLTYLRDNAVWGWHRHDTDGVVENVCVVPEGAEDRVYLVVRRTINGVQKRYVERMASRFFTAQQDAIFMDASLPFNGWNAGATTITISGGVNWGNLELLTLTASGAGTFIPGNVGDTFIVTLTDPITGLETDRVRMAVKAYTNANIVTAQPDKTVPVGLRGVALSTWARAVASVGGLSHLEGKSVSVLGDGFVVSSPNNAGAAPVVAKVTAGVVVLDKAYAVIHVGLPFISDIETLDLDSPSSATIKDQSILVSRVGLYVEGSRGIWIGLPESPNATDPLHGMQEYKARFDENYGGTVSPKTDYIEVNVETNWNRRGRTLVRQVDPLPLSILSITPIGYLPVAA